MHAPMILGGIPVPLHCGMPDVTYEEAGGFTDATMTTGTPVRMRRWRKQLITISGTGWMATGLDALNWDNQHVLYSPAPLRVSTTGAGVSLTSTPRPDVPVTAQALVAGQWVDTPVTVSGGVATPTPVAGASIYTVAWYPQFLVLCTPPPQSAQSGEVSWTLICREV